MEPGDMLRVDLDVSLKPEFLADARPEQLVRVCFPSVSPAEWHPFTLVRAPGSGVATIFISTAHPDSHAGVRGWSGRVAAALAAAPPDELAQVAVRVEGPLGGTAGFRTLRDVEPETEVLFLAGGSGVTPALSYLRDPAFVSKAGKKCALVWSVRGEGAGFSGLRDVAGAGVAVRVHETSGGGAGKVAPSDAELLDEAVPQRIAGRIDFAAELGAYAGRPVAVFVSGPESFRGDARAAVRAFQRAGNAVELMEGSFEL